MILLCKCMHVLDPIFPGKARLAWLVITANKTWKWPSRLKELLNVRNQRTKTATSDCLSWTTDGNPFPLNSLNPPVAAWGLLSLSENLFAVVRMEGNCTRNKNLRLSPASALDPFNHEGLTDLGIWPRLWTRLLPVEGLPLLSTFPLKRARQKSKLHQLYPRFQRSLLCNEVCFPSWSGLTGNGPVSGNGTLNH